MGNTSTTGRTPFARLSDAADEFSDHGFDVSVDRENEQSFDVSPELPGVTTDVALEVVRDVCDSHGLELALETNVAVVSVPN